MHISCLIKRFLIFLPITFICVQHISNKNISQDILVDRIETNLQKLNIKSNALKDILVKNFYFLNIFIIFMIWLAEVFNLFIGKLIATVYFALITFIYYSPLLPESKINSDNLYGLTKDFLLYVALILGMIAYCFKSCDNCVFASKVAEKPKEEETPFKEENKKIKKSTMNKKKKNI